MRFVSAVEYAGTVYAGWQSQSNVPSVEAALQCALSKVANSSVTVVGAGRTDKGVHASQQIFHFDSDSKRSSFSWLMGANRLLPKDIKLLWVKQVSDDFHARYSADYRRYLYLIYNNSTAPALLRPFCHWHYQPLDVGAMAKAASFLVGSHDFSAFRSSRCQAKTTVRPVQHALIKVKSPWVLFDIQAHPFSHKMVRMLMTELLAVGQGNKDPESIAELLLISERDKKPVAKPEGLFLAEVGYADSWHFATVPAQNLWLYALVQ